jgi:hypothetical protein
LEREAFRSQLQLRGLTHEVFELHA